MKRWLLPACILVYLWFTLLNHLRVEWTVNPQYAYGWAVPFLCLYLLWRQQTTVHRPQSTVHGNAEAPKHRNTEALSHCSTVLLAVLALAWLPTRLIQEANPEWRLVSWALALEVVGVTLLLLRQVGQRTEVREQKSEIRGQKSEVRGQKSEVRFALLFFLVAVPWPTVVEGGLIQTLTQANAASAVEVLNLLGITAIQHGNTIEVATGLVGIDEACSGIRSFQSALMLALFLGQFYSLKVSRRLLCVGAGFLFSFLFNLCRTTLLTYVAARKGMAAMEAWHDPAGTAILVGCFASVWAVASVLRNFSISVTPSAAGCRRTEAPSCRPAETLRYGSTETPKPWLLPVLLTWFVVAEVGTEGWYRWHEARLPAPSTWTVELPRENSTFREVPIAPRTKQILRYDEGVSARWQGENQTTWEAVFLHWNPGRTAVNLANIHTPEVCLTASGHQLVSISELRRYAASGLQMPFRVYRFMDQGGPLHVFYCLWEDQAVERSFDTAFLTYSSRLAPVLAGRRESGQRSLEVVLWGIQEQEEAEAVFRRELGKLIKKDGASVLR